MKNVIVREQKIWGDKKDPRGEGVPLGSNGRPLTPRFSLPLLRELAIWAPKMILWASKLLKNCTSKKAVWAQNCDP